MEQAHNFFVKNEQGDYFEIDVLKKEDLDYFLDQLNFDKNIEYVDKVEFNNPYSVPISDETGSIIGILTHEMSILQETSEGAES